MPSQQKRQRQKQGRAAGRAAAEAAKRRSTRRRQLVTTVLVFALVAGLVSLLTSGGSSAKKPATSCPKADGSSPRQASFPAPPSNCIDTKKAYLATFDTDVGTYQVRLDPRQAPKTVNNFVFLARYHFFDGLTFHRVIPGFVVQGGDPQGTGTGGPGYTFADEPPPSAGAYREGSLAMANSGPNTNGSQFFVVTSDAGGRQLGSPNYSLFGQVSSGMDVVKRIEADGSPDGTPKVLHRMVRVTTKEA